MGSTIDKALNTSWQYKQRFGKEKVFGRPTKICVGAHKQCQTPKQYYKDTAHSQVLLIFTFK